jgi:hypothetical protein
MCDLLTNLSGMNPTLLGTFNLLFKSLSSVSTQWLDWVMSLHYILLKVVSVTERIELGTIRVVKVSDKKRCRAFFLSN